MAAKRGRVEIIEVLPADEARHDGQAAAATVTVERPRRSRWWIVVVAGAAIVAVVVGASALSGGSSEGRRAEQAAGSPETAAPAITPVVLPLVPNIPLGYRIAGVEQTATAGDSRPVRQLWSTTAKGSLLGSWVELTASRDGLEGHAAGDQRVAVPAGVGVLDTQGNGDITVSGPIPGGGQATLDSSGVSRATLVELLASLRFDGDALVSSDSRFGTMLQELAADDGAPVAGAALAVAYESFDGSSSFDVTVSSRDVPYDEIARRFFLSRTAEVSVNAQAVVVGNDDRAFGRQSVSFERAGLRITVAGTAPRDVLLAATQSVHVATDAELAALSAAGPPPAGGDGGSEPAVRLAGDLLADGTAYSISLDARPAADGTARVLLSTGGADVRVATLTPRDSYIATAATPEMTALIAFVPDGVDARLVVSIGDPAAPTTLAATPVDLPDGRRVAAVAFAQMQPFQASIHTADGRTLSSVTG